MIELTSGWVGREKRGEDKKRGRTGAVREMERGIGRGGRGEFGHK